MSITKDIHFVGEQALQETKRHTLCRGTSITKDKHTLLDDEHYESNKWNRVMKMKIESSNENENRIKIFFKF